jgi:2-desacetyl-2-hydroxyethyl bacteriochlorophyllide A dehydrogenase
MKQAVYAGDRRFEIRDIPFAAPGAGEVAVRVAWCGICGTDLHIFHGRMDGRAKPPQVIGHEMSGVVEAAGDGVGEWRPGDRVAVRPLDWCGECAACRAGHSHVCMNLKFMGIDRCGAFQEIWTVKARTLHRVPDGVTLKQAALAEPLAVACHDVRAAGLAREEVAAVLGGGPIGLLIAKVAAATGARVLVSEINPHRLDRIRALGFTAVNPLENDMAAAVNAATGGAGADAVFEVTGNAEGAAMMTALARVRGRIVCVAIHTAPQPVDLHRFFWRELRFAGARLYERGDFDAALALVAERKVWVDDLITDVFRLDDIQKGFESLAGRPTAMKTLIKCTDKEMM